MLELKQVSKTYGATTAVAPIDLRFEPGRSYALLGPSGCGKSTLLRLMMRLIEPDAGTVSLDDQAITPENALVLRRRMGYVVQQGGLFPHLTAKSNVTLTARYLKWESRRIDARVAELAELVRLPGEAVNRFAAQLSGGQQQRVGLMRALMLDPEVLLLDEPLGALDPIIRAELQQELRDIFRRLGKTVVLVTHDLSEAAFLGDVILLMRNGRIVQRGSYDELRDSPAEEFVEQFINAQRGPN